MSDISLLASLLRQKGDSILNYKSKLVLTDTLLFKLNKALESLFENEKNSSFNALETPNNQDQLSYDLYFVYDFIQKTKGLKITHCLNHDHLEIDIQQFKNLRHLELRKVSFQHIKNLQRIHHQLKSIICTKGLQNLEDFFLIFGIDLTNNLNWKELQEVNFSYNGITHLDPSLSYAPMLQYLDLSHNKITNAQTISCLPNLRYLNMSYNLLESIPWINQAAFSKLQVLILKNNYIEDILAINMLKNLSELDLSYNYLINHECLNSLSNLLNLSWLSLEGNPLSFHKQHRLRSIQYINQQISPKEFVLDRFLLSKSEQLYIGALSSLKSSTKSDISPNVIQIRDEVIENTVTESISSDTLVNISSKVIPNKRGTKVRNAIISDDDLIESDIDNTLTQSNITLDTSTDHLETKKKIENIRERFGEENWLHNLAGSYVKDILGLPNNTSSTSILSSTPKDSYLNNPNNEFISTLFPSSSYNIQDSIPRNENSNQQLDISLTFEEENSDSKNLFDPLPSPNEKDDQNELDIEDEGHTFLVKRERTPQKPEELFFIVTKSELKERTVYTGKTQEKWPISTLMSCTKIGTNPIKIHLTYDTVRKIKSERLYLLDEENEAKKLVQILRDILDSRSLSEMNQIVFKCIKCSSYFSKEVDNNSKKGNNQGCPTCGSLLIMKQEPEENEKPLRVRDSVSPSSIGPNPVSSEKLIVTALVHEPQISNEKDIVSGQHSSADSLNISPESQCKKYESDIEIISNPSQSSIEVVDEFDRGSDSSSLAKYQNHKQCLEKSKEDLKKTFLPGLTESSSSDSYTESICTAYENQSNLSDKKLKEHEQLEIENLDDCPANTYAKMYEGLLETINSQIVTTSSKLVTNTNTLIFYDNYTQIDHRIKLYLVLNTFEDKEEFLLIIKSKIYESLTNKLYLGCLIFTNFKLYIFNLANEEGEDPEKLLKKLYTFSLEKCIHVNLLPFQQGVVLDVEELDNKYNFILILQDKIRTNNFLRALKDNSSLQNCQINGIAKLYENFEDKLGAIQNIDNKKLLHFVIINKCKLNVEEEYNFELGALMITPNNLFIFDNIQQILCEQNITWKPKSVQNMSNLIEVTNEDFILNLHYLDEVIGTTESWSLTFENHGSLNDTIQALKDPWEKLFLVSLQILKLN